MAQNSNHPILSPDVWMSDGNVVISTVDADKKTFLFKCHRSMLSRHSAVFLDMFGLPQAVGRADEEYEGVPLVVMHDPYEDVRSLLCIIYGPRCSPFEKHDPMLVNKIGGVLRLCVKYEMDTIRAELVSLLEASWPTTLLRWDIAEREITARVLSRLDTPAEDAHKAVAPEPAAVIQLATDLGITSVLPAAFYHLHRVFDASTHHPVGHSSDNKLLTVEDLHRLILGREAIRTHLATEMAQMANLFPTIARPPVHVHRGCGDALLEWWNEVQDLQQWNRFCQDPLTGSHGCSRHWSILPSGQRLFLVCNRRAEAAAGEQEQVMEHTTQGLPNKDLILFDSFWCDLHPLHETRY